MLRPFVLALPMYLIGCSVSQAQGQCPPITNGPVTESAVLAIKPADASCTAPDGGYIKNNVIYKLHISAAVTGSCQWRVWQFPPGICVNSTLFIRTIGISSLFIDGPPYKGVVTASPVSSTNYDTTTTPPTNTTVAGVPWLTTLGTHVYTSSTNANATPCNIAPTLFSQNQAVTVNVLKCEPKWLTDSDDNLVHLIPPTSPDKVQVFLDPVTLSGATTALNAAITDWNNRVSATGVVFERVDSSCGTGASCITVEAVSNLGSCGYSPGVMTDSNGGITGGISLQIDAGWSTWSQDSLQRTFAHELGHRLGLNDYSTTSACDMTGNSAVMQPNFVCAPTSAPLKTLSINDHLPVNNTVYGAKSRLACGF